MGTKRKVIKCECGGQFVEQCKEIEGITSPVMVCDQCEEMMFSLEQSKLYHKLRSIQILLKNDERKISKIGNSMGITLPVKLKELGFNVGKNFNLQILDENKIIIELRP